MSRRKVTEVLIETLETLVIRRQPAAAPLTAWCAPCGQPVEWLTPDEAATRAGTSTRAIFRRVEAGQLHFRESAEGRLWLCANSIGQPAAAVCPLEPPATIKEN